MSWGKHFQSMYTGSMVGAGPDVFAVWGYVLAHKDKAGTVELNPRLIATTIGMSKARAKSAVDYLCAPDPDSRNPDMDGRRLVSLGPFLYTVVSHEKYATLRNDEERKAYERERKADYRARVRDRSGTIRDVSISTSESSSESSSASETEEGFTWQRAGRVWCDALGVDTSAFSFSYHEQEFREVARLARGEDGLRNALQAYVGDDWVRKNKPPVTHLIKQWDRWAGGRREVDDPEAMAREQRLREAEARRRAQQRIEEENRAAPPAPAREMLKQARGET